MLENAAQEAVKDTPMVEEADIEQQESLDSGEKIAQQNDASAYSEVEREAMKQGWRPKEEYSRDDREWIPADEFLRNKPFMDRARNDRRKIQSMERTLQNMKTMMEKAADAARQKTIDELMQQKREAIQSGDVERTEQFEEQINKYKQEAVAVPKSEDTQKEIVQAWAERNKDWLNDSSLENERLVEEATKYEIWVRKKFLKEHGSLMDTEDALEETERYMRQKYSLNRGENPRKHERAAVESNTPAPNKGRKKYNANAITDEMRRFARDFVKHGAYKTEEEYYEQLQQIGVLK